MSADLTLQSTKVVTRPLWSRNSDAPGCHGQEVITRNLRTRRVWLDQFLRTRNKRNYDEVVEKVDAGIWVKTCIWLIDRLSHYIALRSTFIPCPKSYNQTRLGLEFQTKRNPYTKWILIIKENIKLPPCSWPRHRHWSIGNPHVFLQSHRQTSCWGHRQTVILVIGTNTSPPLELVTSSCFLIGNHLHRQISCRLVTVASSADLYFTNSRYASKDTCPKMVSTLFKKVVHIYGMSHTSSEYALMAYTGDVWPPRKDGRSSIDVIHHNMEVIMEHSVHIRRSACVDSTGLQYMKTRSNISEDVGHAKGTET